MRARDSISRRSFLKAAAASAAALPGCLGGAIRDLPSTPARWPTFRFAHLGDLRLSARDPSTRRRAMDAAEAVSGVAQLDFLAVTGELVADADPLSLVLLEDFLRAAGVLCFAASRIFPPAGDPELRHLESLGLAAWAAPWSASPARGVQLAGLAPAHASAAGDDPSPRFLGELADSQPGGCMIALSPCPPRTSPELEKLGFQAGCSEELRFALEAAAPVKIALCGGVPLPFTTAHADLVYMGMPWPGSAPNAVRVVTVMGHGAVVETEQAGPEHARAASLRLLSESDLAKKYDSANRAALGRALEAEWRTRTHALR